MASKLTTKDLRTVRNAVYDAASKWYDLGLELGISPNRLDTIKKDKPEDCLREMLNIWLSDGELTSTWEILSNALCNQAVGLSYIAEKILREKCGILKEESNGSEQSLLSNRAEFASSSSTKMTSSVSSPDIKHKHGLKTKAAESKSDSDLKAKQTPSLFAQKPTPSMDTGSLRKISTPLLYQDPPTTSQQHKPKKSLSWVDHSGHRHGDDQKDPFAHRYRRYTAGDVATEHRRRKTSCPPDQRYRSNSMPGVTVIAEKYNGSEYKFKSKPAPDLYCHECKEIACEPHQMRCNNCSPSTLFCKKCTPTLCPKCEKPTEIFPDGISNSRILKMVTICPNVIPILRLGCSWEGELQTVAEHRLECPRESVPCPYKVIGCEEIMLRYKVEKHEKDNRDAHLDLAMKKIVSMVTSINELTELTATVQKLEKRLEEEENAIDDEIN